MLALVVSCDLLSLFFFFNDTATTEIYTLSLHDALPISGQGGFRPAGIGRTVLRCVAPHGLRSEEHTSELQSRGHIVCRLRLEKKKRSSASISIASRVSPRRVGSSAISSRATTPSGSSSGSAISRLFFFF